jgi:hypothetical protein
MSYSRIENRVAEQFAAFQPLEDGAARRRDSIYQRRIGPQSTWTKSERG